MKKFTRFFLFLISFSGLSYFSFGQLTLVEWNFPNNPDNALVDISNAANAAQTIYSTGGTGALQFNILGQTTWAAWCNNWVGGSGLKAFEINFSSFGFYNLELSSKQQGSNTGPRDFSIEYKIGAAGSWIPLGISVTCTSGGWNGPTSFLLPAACENQSSVYIHWIMSSNTPISGSLSAASASRIDNINITANSNDYYRSVATGNWNQIATWETSPNNLNPWSPAIMCPNKYAKTITVRSPHVVSIVASVNTDETVVNVGGYLALKTGTLTVNDGAAIDLQVDGTFADSSSSNVSWLASSTWNLSAGATFVKISASSASNWQTHFNGGISTIPATANWILRKSGAPNPSLNTANAYYPNFTVENNVAGLWTTSVSSSFQGTGATGVIVKGNMDIGGTGTSTVNFQNSHTYPTPTLVQGNILVRAGNTYTNSGTGTEVQGNLTVDGTITYGASTTSILTFSGSNAQTISGAGTIGIYNMLMNKPSNDITLAKIIKADHDVTFNNPGGRIFSTVANNFVFDTTATATSANNTSFVHGPVVKLGANAFNFPIGKFYDYKPLLLSTGSGGGSVTFWTENFNTGAGWSLANVLGAEGADPNFFTISAAEGGVTPPGCGVANNGNNTMHVTSVFNPTGGAAYDAGGLCGILFCPQTNRRAESPIINCSLFSNITLSFNYIGNGQALIDNATLWYYDGTTWSVLAASLKSTICASLQGQWTAFSIALPASANNNANVKIGFQWQNNDDGVGTDPSFAVDDIKLSVSSPVDAYMVEYFYANPRTTFNNVLNAPLNHISQCEYWNVTKKIAGTAPRAVQLSWDNFSCGVTLLNDLRVAQFNGSSWDDQGNGGTTGTTAAGTINSNNLMTTFGPFTLSSVSTQNPLPVQLLNFDAEKKKTSVDLKWTTASEVNNDFFTLEKSNDKQHFEILGNVKGNVTTNTLHSYSFTDKKPITGINYYRLKQTDFNGAMNDCGTVAVKFSDVLNDITISPNYYLNEILITLSSANSNFTIQLFDVMGKELSTVSNNSSFVYHLSMSGFSSGIYFVKIKTDNDVFFKRFFY